MTTPDLDKLLSRRIRRKPDVVKARQKELVSRAATARNITARAMRQLHPDDWESLYRQARAKLDAERGPLPGDPS